MQSGEKNVDVQCKFKDREGPARFKLELSRRLCQQTRWVRVYDHGTLSFGLGCKGKLVSGGRRTYQSRWRRTRQRPGCDPANRKEPSTIRWLLLPIPLPHMTQRRCPASKGGRRAGWVGEWGGNQVGLKYEWKRKAEEKARRSQMRACHGQGGKRSSKQKQGTAA